MPTAQQARLEFDDVIVDRHAMLVLKAGARVELEPKAFDVLAYLAERPGQLVTKAELIETIWKNVAVTDHVLTRVIGQLRRTLGDDAREARYIETVPTRGYRFVGGLIAANGAGAEQHTTAVPAPADPARAKRPVWRWAAWRSVAVAAGLVLAAAGGWLAAQRWQARTEWTQPPVAARQLTFANALDAYPDFSPDGRFLAYSTSASGAFEIEVRLMAPEARAQRVTSDGLGNIQPDWSPDGQQIAYHSMQAGGIWVVPALGGVARRLAAPGASPAWSPDGRSIVFQSGEPSQVDVGGTPPPSRLIMVDVGSGRQRPLTRAGHPNGGHTEPAWSSDGRRVAFVVRAVSKTEIWSADIDGSEPVRLWRCLPGCSRVAYEADGRALIFSVYGEGYARLSLDPATGAAVGQPVPLVAQRGAASGHIAVSADGRSVAFTEPTTRSNLHALSIDARGQAVGEPVPLTHSSGRAVQPVFSPDGSRIAFSARRGGTQIALVGPTGGEVTPLPLPKPFIGIHWPSWVGKDTVMGIGTDPAGGAAILSIDLTSRETRTVASLGNGEIDANTRFLAPRVTADGQNVVFARADEEGVGVWSMNLASRVERRLTGRDEDAVFPTPSPDGTWIAYERVDAAGMHAVVVPSAGGPARQLTSGRELVWPHSWTSDGSRIFVATRRGGVWSIGYVSRETGKETILTTFKTPHGYLRYPAVSPRGDRVVYEQTETTGNIWQIPLWSDKSPNSGQTP